MLKNDDRSTCKNGWVAATADAAAIAAAVTASDSDFFCVSTVGWITLGWTNFG